MQGKILLNCLSKPQRKKVDSNEKKINDQLKKRKKAKNGTKEQVYESFLCIYSICVLWTYLKIVKRVPVFLKFR
jgi:uncharacterized membrane protein